MEDEDQVRKNLSDNVFNALKTEILFNRIHPGDMICENELCNEYHVSRTPVRQALQKLERLGLVEILDGVGTFVTHITKKQMQDAYQIRCAAEKIALCSAIHNIDMHKLDDLEKRFYRFKNQLSKGGGYGASFEDMILTDWELHDLIIDNSDNELLAESLERVTLILRRYQMAFVSLYERATDDHLEIIRCIRERDLEGVERILDSHLQFRTF